MGLYSMSGIEVYEMFGKILSYLGRFSFVRSTENVQDMKRQLLFVFPIV